jgi:hypothetical protein
MYLGGIYELGLAGASGGIFGMGLASCAGHMLGCFLGFI